MTPGHRVPGKLIRTGSRFQRAAQMTIKLTRLDLDYILSQIEMAEAGQVPVNPLLAFGLREVAGTNNNIAAGQTKFGASDQVFPALTDQMFQKAQFGTSYTQTSGVVVDAAP